MRFDFHQKVSGFWQHSWIDFGKKHVPMVYQYCHPQIAPKIARAITVSGQTFTDMLLVIHTLI